MRDVSEMLELQGSREADLSFYREGNRSPEVRSHLSASDLGGWDNGSGLVRNVRPVTQRCSRVAQPHPSTFVHTCCIIMLHHVDCGG